MTKLKYIYGLMILLHCSNLLGYQCEVEVILKDWKTGFDTKKQVKNWCKEVASYWGIDNYDKHCHITDQYTGLFYYPYGIYRKQYLGNSWRDIIDDIGMGVGGYTLSVEIFFSPSCYYRGFDNETMPKRGPSKHVTVFNNGIDFRVPSTR